MKSWLLFVFVLHNVHTISVGLIPHFFLTLRSSAPLSIMNGTNASCLCAMVRSSDISALNYFSNNTCQLFSNVSLINAYFWWTVNADSLFYFLHLPILAETTTAPTHTSAAITTAGICAPGKHNVVWLSQIY